ncbi:hypothetical protein RC74_18645 [Falsihalocynthiibacter arcticus]|uniref:Uncharacterized protein n=1 Tax=Falsihalocynthiibacter arcticus TaxID=1579316 RepID=A0A126V550_9RHOB|nr:hypothetical protein RC74_18645 [Falsihalocynthiibacter arcticus]
MVRHNSFSGDHQVNTAATKSQPEVQHHRLDATDTAPTIGRIVKHHTPAAGSHHAPRTSGPRHSALLRASPFFELMSRHIALPNTSSTKPGPITATTPNTSNLT